MLGSCTLISILFLRFVFILQMHFFRSFSFSIIFSLCSIWSSTSRFCFFFFFFLSFYFFSVLMAFSLSNYPFLFPSCLFIRSFYSYCRNTNKANKILSLFFPSFYGRDLVLSLSQLFLLFSLFTLISHSCPLIICFIRK